MHNLVGIFPALSNHFAHWDSRLGSIERILFVCILRALKQDARLVVILGLECHGCRRLLPKFRERIGRLEFCLVGSFSSTDTPMSHSFADDTKSPMRLTILTLFPVDLSLSRFLYHYVLHPNIRGGFS